MFKRTFAPRGDFFLKKKEAKKRPLKDNEPTKDNFIDSATPLRTRLVTDFNSRGNL